MRASRVATLVGLTVLVAGGIAGAGYTGRGPLGSTLGIEVTTVAGRSVLTLGPGGDPDVVMVVFPWAPQEYCSGQFTVTATETDQEVAVGQVTSRLGRSGSCAGLGTADGSARAELRLTRPLGSRRVVRASDGVELPVVDPPAVEPPAVEPPAVEPPSSRPPSTRPPSTRPAEQRRCRGRGRRAHTSGTVSVEGL
jgi:hypothetical protein